ncbi:MAG: SDR family NAD(P)-dependent oxidoreductase [Steroidobacteraceae bacterium]
MNRLSGKVAIITGAGSGMGQACMRLFASEGAQVVGVGRTQATLEQTLTSVRERGGSGITVTADLAKEESANLVVSRALQSFGRIDILVHAAGVGGNWEAKSPGSMRDIAATATDKWHEVLAINLDSCFFMCREVIRWLLAHDARGSIVTVSSISGLRGLPSAHAYTAAKAGIINLTRSLCVTYAAKGIRANCITPGLIATPMTEDHLPLFDDPQTASRLSPMARPGTPEEVAYACLYLASDESSYCNGSVLVVDGGTTARQV